LFFEALRSDGGQIGPASFGLGCLYQDSAPEIAETFFLRSISEGHDDAFFQLAELKWRQGDIAAAIDLAQKGRAAHDPWACSLLGDIATEQGDLVDALEFYTEALQKGDEEAGTKIEKLRRRQREKLEWAALMKRIEAGTAFNHTYAPAATNALLSNNEPCLSDAILQSRCSSTKRQVKRMNF
jgi:tetratricopeptide (TPR) repeat protein